MVKRQVKWLVQKISEGVKVVAGMVRKEKGRTLAKVVVVGGERERCVCGKQLWVIWGLGVFKEWRGIRGNTVFPRK